VAPLVRLALTVRFQVHPALQALEVLPVPLDLQGTLALRGRRVELDLPVTEGRQDRKVLQAQLALPEVLDHVAPQVLLVPPELLALPGLLGPQVAMVLGDRQAPQDQMVPREMKVQTAQTAPQDQEDLRETQERRGRRDHRGLQDQEVLRDQ